MTSVTHSQQREEGEDGISHMSVDPKSDKERYIRVAAIVMVIIHGT